VPVGGWNGRAAAFLWLLHAPVFVGRVMLSPRGREMAGTARHADDVI